VVATTSSLLTLIAAGASLVASESLIRKVFPG
jgi:hypothetical protein